MHQVNLESIRQLGSPGATKTSWQKAIMCLAAISPNGNIDNNLNLSIISSALSRTSGNRSRRAVCPKQRAIYHALEHAATLCAML